MKLICWFALLSITLLVGCGKKATPESQAKANAPSTAQESKKTQSNNKPEPKAETKKTDEPKAPKVESAKVMQTPGMKAAGKAYDKGQYTDAVRLYTAELVAEKAKPLPSWVQLSHLNGELGDALNSVGQYDKALECSQESLAIRLKHLGVDHLDVASSYSRIAAVYFNIGKDDKAQENWEKSYAIRLKKLGPDNPYTMNVKVNLDRLKE